MRLLICSNVYDDVRDFKLCGLIKSEKAKYLENVIPLSKKNQFFIFLLNKKSMMH